MKNKLFFASTFLIVSAEYMDMIKSEARKLLFPGFFGSN